MKLCDLEPQFVRYERRYIDGLWGEYIPKVESLADAQGMRFLCPSCFVRNGGAVNTHQIEVSFAERGVQDQQGSHDRNGNPVRWTVHGTDFRNLSTQPSILIDPAKPVCDGWHGFIKNGEVA